jgi:putative endonuclease
VTTDRRQTLGRAGERLAQEHYERLGYRILARNWRTRRGELDLVVCDRRAIVFVEVKSVRDGDRDPFEAITARKQRRLRELAAAWLGATEPRVAARELRFDAVGVVIDRGGRLLSLEQREAVM